jgi:GTP-binding protein EngB required for normal cell division
MGGSPSQPVRESPTMEVINQLHCLEKEKADLESQRKLLENQNKFLESQLEAQVNESKAKEQSAELETLKMKFKLLDEKTTNEEMSESLRLIDEQTRDVRPAQWPTPQQFERTKKQYNYSPEKFHIAISGQSGTGKSSLINALRNLYPEDTRAAATGDVECTMIVTRYPDPDPNKCIIWFDVPGAGTQSHPEAEYFNDKGLYVFDAVLVIIGDRFGSTDISILRQCGLYGIPSYIVRSKADNHVRNRYQHAVDAACRKRKKKKFGGLSRDEESRLFDDEKRSFEKETRESVNRELTRAGLPIQPVFIISREGLLNRVRVKMSKIANTVMEMEDEGAEIKFEDGDHNDGAGRGGQGEVQDGAADGDGVGDAYKIEDADGDGDGDGDGDRDGDGDGDGDEDGDEDEPYVVFDEERLLADLIHTSFRTRVAKDPQWFESLTNSLSKRFPSGRLIKSWLRKVQHGQGPQDSETT